MAGIENPIDWRAIEDAIQAWFEESTGLGSGKVLWGNQGFTQPPYPYATLTVIAGPTHIGGDDETRCRVVEGDPKLFKVGLREMTLSCQVHIGPESVANPEQHARALMSRAQAALALPLYRDALNKVGLSVIQDLAIVNLDVVIADEWISRVGMDVRLGLASTISQDIQVIEDVRINGTVSRAEGDPAPIAMDEIGG